MSNEIFSTSIKLENDPDDDSSYANSYSISNNLHPSLGTSVYKGKIEVTSKGRRKIFDGVRWQILCRRPECRKQTNKKSLCITHYKEEYESNSHSSFRLSPYPPQHRIEIDEQNHTISTTNINDHDQANHRSFDEGFIKYTHNGRRFIFKNSKWQPLCKYDHICRNQAKYQSLCIKHYELTQRKRNDHQRLQKSISNKYHSILTSDKTKHFKANDFSVSSSSSFMEQFDINRNENSCPSTKLVNPTLTSKIAHTSSNEIPDDLSMKTDQSVQTDLSIPFCCLLHYANHSFSASCTNHKRTSSKSTKYASQTIVANFSI